MPSESGSLSFVESGRFVFWNFRPVYYHESLLYDIHNVIGYLLMHTTFHFRKINVQPISKMILVSILIWYKDFKSMNDTEIQQAMLHYKAKQKIDRSLCYLVSNHTRHCMSACVWLYHVITLNTSTLRVTIVKRIETK